MMPVIDVDFGKVSGSQTPPGPPDMTNEARFAKLEAVVPTLATKSDLASEVGGLRTDMQKGFFEQTRWIVGTAIALAAAGITVMTFVLNNAAPKSPAQSQAPTVIVLPAPGK